MIERILSIGILGFAVLSFFLLLIILSKTRSGANTDATEKLLKDEFARNRD